MPSLTGWTSSGNAPTGPRIHTQLDGAPLEGVRVGLGNYVEAAAPFWENPTVLFILAVVTICLLVVLIMLVCKKNSERRDYRDINRRMEMERAHMRSGLFDAASDITRASAMYGTRDRRR